MSEAFFVKLLDKYAGYEEDMYRALHYKFETRPRWPVGVDPKPARLAPGDLPLSAGSPAPPPPPAQPIPAPLPIAIQESPPRFEVPRVRSSPKRRGRSGGPERRLDYQGIPRERKDFRTAGEWASAPKEGTLLRDREGNLLPRKTPVFLAKRPCDADVDAFVCARCPSCSAVLDLLLRPDALHVDEILEQLSQSYTHMAQLEHSLDTVAPNRGGQKGWNVQPPPIQQRRHNHDAMTIRASPEAQGLAAANSKVAKLERRLQERDAEVLRLKAALNRMEAHARTEAAGYPIQTTPPKEKRESISASPLLESYLIQQREREQERELLMTALNAKTEEVDQLKAHTINGMYIKQTYNRQGGALPEAVDIIPMKKESVAQSTTSFNEKSFDTFSEPVTTAPVVISRSPLGPSGRSDSAFMNSLLAEAAPNTLALMKQKGDLRWK